MELCLPSAYMFSWRGRVTVTFLPLSVRNTVTETTPILINCRNLHLTHTCCDSEWWWFLNYVLYILWFVDRASRYIYEIKNQLDAQFIISIFRQLTSTCFGRICSPSPIGTTYTVYIQQLVFVVLSRWLSVDRPSFVHFSFYWVRGHHSHFHVAYDYRF